MPLPAVSLAFPRWLLGLCLVCLVACMVLGFSPARVTPWQWDNTLHGLAFFSLTVVSLSALNWAAQRWAWVPSPLGRVAWVVVWVAFLAAFSEWLQQHQANHQMDQADWWIDLTGMSLALLLYALLWVGRVFQAKNSQPFH